MQIMIVRSVLSLHNIPSLLLNLSVFWGNKRCHCCITQWQCATTCI